MKTLKKILYITLQWTWGFLQSFIGLIFMLRTVSTRREQIGGAVLNYHDGKWGGVSMGMFIFVNGNRDEKWISDAITHEYGHTIQSLMLGPLYMFVVGIPSFIWCNSKKYIAERAKGVSYYDFWVERQANRLGARALKRPLPTYSDDEAAKVRAEIERQANQSVSDDASSDANA